MRALTILLMLSLSAILFAVGQAVPSPANHSIWAKVAKSKDYGQQVFISTNGGKSFNQITWPSCAKDEQTDNSQALSCQWSAKGWLLIEFNCSLGQKFVRSKLIYSSTIGVFDPVSKIIYWPYGCQPALGREGSDPTIKPKWIGPDTIYYRTTPCHADNFKGIVKNLKLTPELLKKSCQDLNYYLFCFSSNMLKAVGTPNFSAYLAKIAPQNRAAFKKFCDENRDWVTKYYVLSAIESDQKTYCQLSFIPEGAKFDEWTKAKHAFPPLIELDYDLGKQYYRLTIVDPN